MVGQCSRVISVWIAIAMFILLCRFSLLLQFPSDQVLSISENLLLLFALWWDTLPFVSLFKDLLSWLLFGCLIVSSQVISNFTFWLKGYAFWGESENIDVGYHKLHWLILLFWFVFLRHSTAYSQLEGGEHDKPDSITSRIQQWKCYRIQLNYRNISLPNWTSWAWKFVVSVAFLDRMIPIQGNNPNEINGDCSLSLLYIQSHLSAKC